MDSIILAFLIWLVALVSYIFLIFRLSLFKDKTGGRFPFTAGGILITVALSWQIFKNSTVYPNLFLEYAYPILDITQAVIFIGGILFTVVGVALYADYWQS